MPKSFPHLEILSEETDAQNKSTKNTNEASGIYIFLLQRKKEVLYQQQYFKTIREIV